jgi:hypothetical protein
MGTIVRVSSPSYHFEGMGGTFFIGPRPTTPQLTYKEQRAEDAIKEWKLSDGDWKKLRSLIVAAMQDVVDEECGDEDGDDE